MQIQKTEILVLSSKNSDENDVTCTALSPEFGKINLIFKGLLKSKRRSICIRDPGSVAEIIFYRKESKSFFYISDFVLISTPEKVRNNVELYYYHCFLLELISKITTENTKNSFIYNISKKVLAILETEKDSLMLVLFFVLHVLQHNGIMPDLSQCEVCGSSSASHYNLDFNGKSLICRECTPSYNRDNFSFSSNTVTFMNNSLKTKYSANDFSIISRLEAEKSLFYLVLFLEDYFHIIINSKDFIFKK
ncbi:MAG: DNA repair protein RecO [Spirochaetes bacterium]|nr:DNA repair protein RecO [Spirochaetota bacterium]